MILNKNEWKEEDFIEFREYIESLKDEVYNEFSSNIIPGSKIIGIRTPILKDIAKEISKGNIISFLNINPVYYEEKIIKASVIGKVKEYDKALKYIDDYALQVDSWATCDCAVCTFKIIKKHLKEFQVYIEKYLNSDEPYIIRYGLILMLSYYINDEYIEWVINKISEVKCDDYYVMMGNAWLISVCYIKQKEKTMCLFDGRLDKVTHNKAISKIHDSLRVTKEEKIEMNKLRQ